MTRGRTLMTALTAGALATPPASRAAEAGALTLVETGIPAAVIVLAEEPTRVAEFAARELQHHIRLISGAVLPIDRRGTSAPGTRILVGDSPALRRAGVDVAKLAFEEYIIRLRPNELILAGHDAPAAAEDLVYDMEHLAAGKGWPGFWDERGTLHAVYDFLERFCGVRWFNQTEFGTVVPKTDTLEVRGGDVRRAPAFVYRDALAALADNTRRYDEYVALWTRNTPQFGEWTEAAYPALRGQYSNQGAFDAARGNMALLFALRMRNGGRITRCNHSLYGYYDRFWEKSKSRPNLFVAKRPEMFAQGYEGKPPQLCYSSPELIRQVAQDARDYYDGKSTGADQGIFWRPALPNLFPVEPMDNSSFCRCPRCQAFFQTEDRTAKGLYSRGTHSNYFFQFVNRVANELNKTHPDKQIVTLAYMTHARMPDFKLNPNVVVQFCFTANRAPHSPNYKHELKILKEWADEGVGRPLYLWLYYTFPKERAVNGKYHCFPGFFSRTIGREFKLFKKYGIQGMFHCGYGQEVEAYLTFKLMDDPGLDVDDLLDDYFTGLYGKAGKPLKRFYLGVEKVFSNPGLRPKKKLSGPQLNWGVLGTRKRMTRYAALVARARKLAETPEQKARVDLFDKAFLSYMQAGRKQYLDRSRAPIPSVTAPRVAPAGGDPAKVAWDRAGELGENWYQRGGNTPSKRRLGGRIAHDGAYLYLELTDRCDTSKLVASPMVFPFDDWEVFLANQREVPYRQYAVSPTGLVESLSHGEVNFRMNVKIENPGVKAISDASAADRWITRLAIPFDRGLSEGIRPGETVYMNILRVSSPGVSGEPRLGLDTWVSYCTVHEVDRLAAIKLAE